MNVTSSILKVLSGETLKTPPIWFMRQAGRHLPEYRVVRETTKTFIDFCLTPDKATEVTLQPVRRYDVDAAILFADILLIPMTLGRDVQFIKGTGPVLGKITPKDISKLKRKGASERLSNIYETVRRVRHELGDDKALIGFAGGPWTVATYMIEGQGSPMKEVAKRFAYENPKAMEDLLSVLADVSADYLIEQAKAGADVLKIFESWAEGLSPDQFKNLVIAPTRRIIEQIRSAGITKPIIGFPRAAGFNSLDYIEQTGVTAIAAGTDTSISTLRAHIPPDMAIQGNLDPLALRIGGETLRKAVQGVLDDASGPHIFNLGHGVNPDVKIENMHAVINHIRNGDGDYVV